MLIASAARVSIDSMGTPCYAWRPCTELATEPRSRCHAATLHPSCHADVYLEELADTAPEADCTTQTDAFLDRPPTPAFVPQKSGVDSATQIEQGEIRSFSNQASLNGMLTWNMHGLLERQM